MHCQTAKKNLLMQSKLSTASAITPTLYYAQNQGQLLHGKRKAILNHAQTGHRLRTSSCEMQQCLGTHAQIRRELSQCMEWKNALCYILTSALLPCMQSRTTIKTEKTVQVGLYTLEGC